jgi:uncharacterized protein DUF4386
MNSPQPPVNLAELRIAAAFVFLGGVGGFIANLFHPTPTHQTEALLRMVAAAPYWSQLHFLIMISVVLLVCGMAMLTRNLAHPTARAIATAGRYVLILGGAVYLVEVMIDGFATKFFADRWTAATDPALKASLFASADAVAHVWFALFPVFASVFLGLGFLLIGVAVTRSGNLPSWLGYWGALGGALCLLTGVGYATRIPVPLPVWIAGVVLVASWGLVLGPMMWRASSRSAGRPLEPAS